MGLGDWGLILEIKVPNQIDTAAAFLPSVFGRVTQTLCFVTPHVQSPDTVPAKGAVTVFWTGRIHEKHCET